MRITKNLSRHLIPNFGTILMMAAMLFGYTVWAAPHFQGFTPGFISYQGTLTDSSGQPINGNTDLTFRLYDVDTGGTALWTEAHAGANAVPVENGLFRLALGSLTPIPSSVWDSNLLYLGVQVGSSAEMTPREQLGAVPYAMRAMQAGTALTVSDGAITSYKMAPSFLEAQLSSDVTITTGVPDLQEVLRLDVQPAIPTTYLLFSTVSSEHTEDGRLLYCSLFDENGERILRGPTNSHPAAGGSGTTTSTVVGRHTFQPGNHSIVMKCTNTTSGQTAYVNHITKIFAIPFSQEP